ncbi:MAG: hypothetical protein Q9169_000773 [Polycauliona sp. 2 TL-2023]
MASSNRKDVHDQSQKVIEVTSPLVQVLGIPPIDARRYHFDARETQKPRWRTPDNIQETLEYQERRYEPTLPKERSFENQRPRDQSFDPNKGPVYSGCTQCDPAGGPTDCQHPEDPRKYTTELNPIPKGDPAFSRCRPAKALLFTPNKTNPGSKLISNPSPSKPLLSPETVSRDDCSSTLTGIGCAKGLKVLQSGEMLAARHLSNFLTENVEPEVATSYIIFTTHGALLGYSSPLPVTTARNIAAITGTTWRITDAALVHGTDVKPAAGSASLLKVLETTQAEKASGLFNIICEYKQYLMSVQWIQPSMLLATMIEVDDQLPTAVANKGKFSLGAGDSEQGGDEEWIEDEGAVEETSEDEEDDRAKFLSKKLKLFHKSQGMASALREQWKTDGFKPPSGFR